MKTLRIQINITLDYSSGESATWEQHRQSYSCYPCGL